MVDNYFKTALRNFRRDKGSFLINVIGLAAGMACSILIMLWLFDELSYDRFHEDSDRIYRVMEHVHFTKGNDLTTTSTPGPLAPALKQDIPEIAYAATYTWNVDNLVTFGEKSFKESGIYARPDLFKILTIDLVSGSPKDLLVHPNSIVIAQELAKKYFGNGNPVGKSLILNKRQAYKVTGVFNAIPRNSSLKFDYVLPFEDFEKQNLWAADWGNQGPRTIAKLTQGSDRLAVGTKIKDFVRQRVENSHIDLFLYPYADLYLHSRFENGQSVGGRIEYVQLFAIIAILVLLIACINFMNLSTARSAKRAREVGVRKSIGASRASLVLQFIGESMMVAFMALLLSLLLVELLLPAFNNLAGKEIAVHYTRPSLLMVFAAVALITGLLAGSYPAFYLSTLQTVIVLKGIIRTAASEVFARKGLVVFQFVMSVILIVSTIVIYNQIRYVQNKNLGYQKENLIYFPIEGDLVANWDAFRHKALEDPAVTHISRANHIFMGRNTNTWGVDWPGKPEDEAVLFETVRADYGLIETMGLRLAQGRGFSREYGLDTARVILNQAAVDVMGMGHPIGQSIHFWNRDWEIIGVLENFHFQSLHFQVEPLLMTLDPENARAAFVRVAPNDINETLKGLEATFKAFNSAYPFAYRFMDEEYAELYRGEMLVGQLAKYFGILAILISSLGLLGLSAFSAQQRLKEIGVRKVLGATVADIVALLSGHFLKLILLANLIAGPIAYYAMNKWLSDFAYHVDVAWWVFVLAAGFVLAIALLTVSSQAVRAAASNPVESLRYE